MENAQKEDNLQHYLSIIYRRKWLVVFATISCVLLAIIFTPEPVSTYKALTKVMIKLPVFKNPMLKDIDIPLEQEQIIEQTKIIKSRTLAEKVLQDLSMEKMKLAKFRGDIVANRSFPADIDALQSFITVRNIMDTNLLEITFFGESAEMAKKIVELIAQNFIMQNLKASAGVSNTTVNPYVAAEVTEPLREEFKGELVKLELERSLLLREYTSNHPKVQSIDEKIGDLVKNMQDIDSKNKMVVNVKLLGETQVEEKRAGSKKAEKAFIGGLIGFLLGISLIFLLEHMDTSIKTITDISYFLNQPVIGTIPVIPNKKEKFF